MFCCLHESIDLDVVDVQAHAVHTVLIYVLLLLLTLRY